MTNNKINLIPTAIIIVSFWLFAFVSAHALGMLTGDASRMLAYQNVVSREAKESITSGIVTGFRIVGAFLGISGVLFLLSFIKREFLGISHAIFLKWALLSAITAGTIYGALMRIVGNQQGAALLFFFTLLIYLMLIVLEKKAVKMNPLFHIVLLLPLYAVLLYTMGIPGWAKIFGGPQVIERYVNMFRDSFIAQLPGGTSLMIYVLGALELAIPALLIISLVKGEFRLTAGKTWFNYALVLSMFTFGMLCFGLAVLFNFAGSANLVFYPIFTLLALVSINQLTQQAALAGK